VASEQVEGGRLNLRQQVGHGGQHLVVAKSVEFNSHPAHRLAQLVLHFELRGIDHRLRGLNLETSDLVFAGFAQDVDRTLQGRPVGIL